MKAIITIDSGLLSVTRSSDIIHWSEFKEYEFNPTYFYTGFNSGVHVPVFPIRPETAARRAQLIEMFNDGENLITKEEY